MSWLSLVRPRDLAIEAAKNAAMSVPVIRKARAHWRRTALSGARVSAEFALMSFEHLQRGLGGNSLSGKTLLEIGPGDHLALGLLAYGAGVAQYIAADRFMGDVTGTRARAVYASTAELAPEGFQRQWRSRGLDLPTYPWPEVQLMREPLEEVKVSAVADVIFSFNVLEHLYSLPSAFAAMRRLLKPGGMMVHKVDYSPHGRWQSYANPLSFLAVPQVLWDLTASHRGTPNRVRHQQMLEATRGAGFEVTAEVIGRFAAADVESARPHLAKDVQLVLDDVASALIVAR